MGAVNALPPGKEPVWGFLEGKCTYLYRKAEAFCQNVSSILAECHICIANACPFPCLGV